MTKPITLYSHASVSAYPSTPSSSIPNHCLQGPNPWKVAIVLEELALEYETKFLEFPHGVKAPEYTVKNPNGR